MSYLNHDELIVGANRCETRFITMFPGGLYADQPLAELCSARLSKRGLRSGHNYVTNMVIGPWSNQVASLASVSIMKNRARAHLATVIKEASTRILIFSLTTPY